MTQVCERHIGITGLIVAALVLASCNIAREPVWELSQELVIELADDERVRDLQIAPNGELLGILTGQRMHVYNFPGLKELWYHETAPDDFVFSQDGTMLAYDPRYEQIEILQANTGEAVQALTSGLERATSIGVFAFSPDDSLLAATVTPGPGEPTVVVIWDTHTAEKALTLQAEEALTAYEGMSWRPMTVEFSPDGSILATGLFGSRIILWDIQTGARIRDLRDLENAFGTVDTLSWHPDDTLLVSGNRGGTVAIWDPYAGELLRSFEVDAKYPRTDVYLSPNGRILAIGTSNGIQLLDTEGNLLQTFEVQAEFGFSIAWSPDGKHLAASDGSGQVYVWETQE